MTVVTVLTIVTVVTVVTEVTAVAVVTMATKKNLGQQQKSFLKKKKIHKSIIFVITNLIFCLREGLKKNGKVSTFCG